MTFLFVTIYVDDRLITAGDPNELMKLMNDLIQGDFQVFKPYILMYLLLEIIKENGGLVFIH